MEFSCLLHRIPRFNLISDKICLPCGSCRWHACPAAAVTAPPPVRKDPVTKYKFFVLHMVAEPASFLRTGSQQKTSLFRLQHSYSGYSSLRTNSWIRSRVLICGSGSIRTKNFGSIRKPQATAPQPLFYMKKMKIMLTLQSSQKNFWSESVWPDCWPPATR